jgi:hypothetical protein
LRSRLGSLQIDQPLYRLVDRWWFVVSRDQVNMVLSSWSTSGCSISRVGRSRVFSSSRRGLVLYTE